MDDVRITTGTLVADLVLPAARSLKDRRGPQRALVQRLRNQDLAVAQVGPADLVQRLFLAISAVSGSPGQVDRMLDAAERMLYASEFEVANLQRDMNSASFVSGA